MSNTNFRRLGAFRWLVAAGFMVTLLAGWLPGTAMANDKGGNMLVFIGTYTDGDSKGIYAYRFNGKTGDLEPAAVTEGVVNPSFLAIHQGGKFLYAVNETGDYQGKPSGAVTAFEIVSKEGALKKLNMQPSMGGAPCHIVVDHAGKNVLVANYTGGSVAVLPIADDGSLNEPSSFIRHEGSSITPRQKGPHGHSINLDAAGRFAFAADLGLDKVLIYRFDSKAGKLTANDPAFADVKPGAGPRHFAFHPSGKHAYVINELDSTITVFGYDAERGSLDVKKSISTLPAGFEGRSSTAEVQVHPSGKFVYGSNRGHDSIACYQVDEKTGDLSLIAHQPTGGKTPRNFGIDPSGKFLLAANQSTGDVRVFSIDADTGRLKETGHAIDVPAPVCVKFLAVED